MVGDVWEFMGVLADVGRSRRSRGGEEGAGGTGGGVPASEDRRKGGREEEKEESAVGGMVFWVFSVSRKGRGLLDTNASRP